MIVIQKRLSLLSARLGVLLLCVVSPLKSVGAQAAEMVVQVNPPDTVLSVPQGSTKWVHFLVTKTSTYGIAYFWSRGVCDGVNLTCGTTRYGTSYMQQYGSPASLSYQASVADSVSVTPRSDLEDGTYSFRVAVDRVNYGGGWFPNQTDSAMIRVNVSTPGVPHPHVKFLSTTDSTVWVVPADPNDPNYPFSGGTMAPFTVTNTTTAAKTFLMTGACPNSVMNCYGEGAPQLNAGASANSYFVVWANSDCCSGPLTIVGRRGVYATTYPNPFITESIDTLALNVRVGFHYRAKLSPRTLAKQRFTFQQAADTFYVRNSSNNTTGSALPATYQMSANCGRFTSCGVTPSAVAMYAGDSVRVVLTYLTDSIVTAPNPVYVKAKFQDYDPTFNAYNSDSVALQVSVVDNLAATIALTGPAQNATIATQSFVATVNVCDADGTIRATTTKLNGVSYGPPLVSSTSAGCKTAKSGGALLTARPGVDTLIVTASDGVHLTTLSRIFTYDPTDEHKPLVTPMFTTASVLISAAGADTFVVRNPGPMAATYNLTASCTVFAVGCTVNQTSASVAGGASLKVVVRYTYVGSNPTGAVLTLTASHTGMFGRTVTTSASNTLNALSGAAPIISLSPLTGTVNTTGSTAITATWCAASALTTHDVYLDSLRLADTYVATTVSGCAFAGTSSYSSVALKPWEQVISAVAVDAQNRRSSVGNAVTYNAPLSAVRPLVTPKNTTTIVSRGAAASQLFTVSNPTGVRALYGLWANCGTASACMIYRGSLDLAPGASDTARVFFTMPSTIETTSTIKFAANYTVVAGTVADTGSVLASTPTYTALYQADVTPKNDVFSLGGSLQTSIYFAVKNLGTDSATYTLPAPIISGGWTIPSYGLPPTTVVVAPGQTTSYGMALQSPGGTNPPSSLTSTAGVTTSTGLAAASTGKYTLIVREPLYAVKVTPYSTATMRYPRNSRQDYSFTVTNAGNYATYYSYTPMCTGFVVAPCDITVGPTGSLMPGESRALSVSLHTSGNATVNSGQLRLAADFAGGGYSAHDTGTVNVVPMGVVLRQVAVMPDSVTLRAPIGTTRSYSFAIKNRGDSTTRYSYDLSCTGAVVSCTLDDTTTDQRHGRTTMLGPEQSATLGLKYTTGPTLGIAGSLLLVAKDTADQTLTATGKLLITTAFVDPVTVVANAINPGTSVSKGSCLTIAVSDAAAYECGELRVVHGLPAVTTLGKARAPTLIYSSRTGAPSVMVGANVTLEAAADSIVATLTLKAGTVDRVITKSYGWNSTWPSGIARRISIPVLADTANLLTGAYHYTLQIATRKGGAVAQTGQDTGTIVIVNRAKGAFGSGWWLDGLEEVSVIDSLQRLWIGGDGSTRMYRRATAAATDTTFMATPMIDRPDKLVSLGVGAGYKRRLRNGAYVEFDAQGHHVATRDALGYTTTFVWDSLLKRVVIPVPIGGPVREFVFSYGADINGLARLTSIQAPNVGTIDRVTTITSLPSGAITQIRYLASTNPKTTTVSFGYSPSVTDAPSATSRLLVSRTDRSAHTSYFHFDAVRGLDSTRFDMGGTGDDIVHKFCASETRSLSRCSAEPEALSSAYTKWDGPRGDVPDTTIFYLNRFGAPDTVVNALGQATRITRDAVFPLLPAKVVTANGFTTEAWYGSRGLPELLRAYNPFGNNQNADTRYYWNPKWDLADSTVAPSGEKTFTGYEATGTWPYAVWRQDGRGTLSRANFTYNAARQLTRAASPGNAATVGTQLDYDSLGNLSKTTSAIGFVTNHFRDAIGRDTLTIAPTDSAQTPGLRTKSRTVYDAEDRVERADMIAAPTSFALSLAGGTTIQVPGDTLSVFNQYDLEGNLYFTQRTAAPDRAAIGDVMNNTSFDAAGRVTGTSSMGGGAHAFTYDAAGNRLTETVPGGDVITFKYDTLNRLTKRVQNARSLASTNACSATWSSPWIAAGQVSFFCQNAGWVFPLWGSFAVPKDSDTFIYNNAGQMMEARNGSAIVRRTYSLGGALLTDTLRIATYAPTSGDDFSTHIYPLTYGYDVAGRRTSLSFPASLVNGSIACIGAPTCTQYYGYDATSGFLTAVTDILGTGYGFVYDSAGRIRSRTAPGAVSESFEYDIDGRLKRRQEWGFGIQVHGDTYRRDAQGRIVDATTQFATEYWHHIATNYNGLGAVVGMQDSKNNAFANVDLFEVDAFGHQTRSESISNTNQHRVDRQLYQSGTELLKETMGDTARLQMPTPTMQYQKMLYTNGGALEWAINQEWSYSVSSGISGPDVKSASRSFYQPDGKLRAYSRGGTSSKRATRNMLEEYRYDALGRRILERSQADSTCALGNSAAYDGVCRSGIARAVWDGDQLLMEERSVVGHFATAAQLELGLVNPIGVPTYGGRVVYTHAGGIDAPLSVIRNGALIMPHANWRGEYDAGTTGTGFRQQDDVDWSGNDMRPHYASGGWEGNVGWVGSLLNKKRDESGLMYMRNRYYDPASGRFTQEDPLGLAGGMNLYGFGGGDPVNFSDPFGLSPDCTKPGVKCPEPGAFVADQKLMNRAEQLYNAAAGDDRERSVFLFRNKDGSIRTGKVSLGAPHTGTVDVGAPPDDAIGEMHTHQDRVLSGGFVLRGGTPSGPDAARAGGYHVNSVVIGKDKVYVIPWDASQSYRTYDRPKATTP